MLHHKVRNVAAGMGIFLVLLVLLITWWRV